ncbi:bifunctional DNA-formamidopyrimidine glycosylase/DNA-(apurinic or apyrimidinic site) lyase [Zooshikella marina]|uniref:bifunctional DNA-formamidopyrimidine glycosylase/DNA-(apurinic or apyrimidinic site) lyase n=1 Tax=Zooshikella ganghwensis TaxID=202772 RepID=UPI001BB00F9C|nr:bifunctional DNA-formamidopyrimidine glycosylase/DNA-(apurinic or apyrimidinic site) lyase [Zooshikella ganghwensis]MBU2706360.1 bifunctional DNA-formamidopyrimidine glycosylase/DNA-(apurinic or apyrimidinic site) lyase [Zooshikella ganghwensis]
MPELPEVETTCRGIAPHIIGHTFQNVIIRQAKLRWAIPEELSQVLPGMAVNSVSRRGKYILLATDHGSVIIHLGMSGSLRVLLASVAAGTHDHVDFVFSDGKVLRYTDPRRFGAVLWTTLAPEQHKLLKSLGPEPLADAFDTAYLFERSRTKQLAVKNFIMDSHVVVGVGNIYANEALFKAGIHPNRAANKISKVRYQRLVDEIKHTLTAAIDQGGTTLKDFVGGDGKPGYFKQELMVYGRAGKSCVICGTVLQEIRLAQRSTVYCKHCQR